LLISVLLDAFFWLAGFVMLGQQLSSMKVTGFIGSKVSYFLESASPVTAAVGLGVAYFLLMYLFSSMTAHCIAFAGPFLSAGKSLGCPSYLIVALIAYTSSLCGSLTNYSSGASVLYFSQGYVTQARYMAFGALVGFFNIFILLTVGLSWWKLLGWW
jgi:DASS family divalent anion:Na+ symporter